MTASYMNTGSDY